jgi:KDO2-lipid IV(A) lauroyltransferase
MSATVPAATPSGLRAWRKRIRRRWKHKPGLVPWLTWQPMRAALFLLSLLPVGAQAAFADRIGRIAWWSARRRRTGRAQILRALPDLTQTERDRILRASCGHLGRAGIEVMSIAQRYRNRFEERIQFEPGAREIMASLRGQAVVAVQPHLGSVDIGGVALALAGLQPAFPMRLPSNWYLGQRLAQAREGQGVRLLDRHGAVRGLLAQLKSGGTAVLATDQNAHHAPVFVEWFGYPAATERAAAALALKTGAAVLVFWCPRGAVAGTWSFGCSLVRGISAPAPADDESVRHLTLRMHHEMENAILRWPEQYLWIHDRYRTRPAEESAHA